LQFDFREVFLMFRA